MNLTTQQTATVLAALRYFQLNTFEKARTDSFPLHFGECDPLSDDEIDELCESINMGEEQHNYIVSCDGDANIEFPLKAKTREAAMEEAFDTIGYSVLYDDDEDLEEEPDEDLEGA